MDQITNYTTLKSALASYLHRSDQTDNIPVFIALAHARIQRDLMSPYQIKRYTQTISGATRYVDIPTATKKLKDVQVEISGGRQSVLPLSAAQMNTIHSTVAAGSPTRSYCLRGRTMEFQPTIPDGTVLEMLTVDRLDGFTDDTDTNDILTNNPNIYVYAAMIEASIFLQGDERLKMFTAAYDAEVETLNEEAEDYELSGGPIQIIKLGVSTP